MQETRLRGGCGSRPLKQWCFFWSHTCWSDLARQMSIASRLIQTRVRSYIGCYINFRSYALAVGCWGTRGDSLTGRLPGATGAKALPNRRVRRLNPHVRHWAEKQSWHHPAAPRGCASSSRTGWPQGIRAHQAGPGSKGARTFAAHTLYSTRRPDYVSGRQRLRIRLSMHV